MPHARVARLHVRTASPDRTRAGVALAAQLGRADWTVPGLPPAAILVVRALRDPLPGALAPTLAAAAPHERAWSAALTRTLAELARGAARPAAAPPGAADAVVFADRAELLACLARDAAAGVLHDRWWWRVLLGAERPPTVAGAWLATPEAVAGAVTLLCAWRAEPAVRALDAAAARACAAAVLRVHGVAPQAAPAREAHAARALVAAVPETRHPELGPADRVLVGCALALRRTPVLARRPGMIAAAIAHWAVASTPPAPPAPAQCGGASAAAHEDPAAPRTAGTPEERPVAAAHAQTAPPPAGAGGAPPAPAADSPASPPLAPPIAPAPPAPASTPPGTVERAAPRAPDVGASTADGAVAETTRAPARQPPLAHDPPALAPRTHSELAGALLLLNVMLALELYADFSRPLDPGLPLHPFQLVARLARRLGGARYPDDPLWPLLVELADDDEVFSPPADWRVPDDWLAPFGAPAASWRWERGPRGVSAHHPAGFRVLDRPATPSRAPAERWLTLLAEYVRARLVVALGVGPRAAAHLVIRRPGVLEPTAGRLDVTFALDAHPLALRRAGLDRDPGWIPAAGRHVAFHFV